MADGKCDEFFGSDELRKNFKENSISTDDGTDSPVGGDVLKFDRSQSDSNSAGSRDATMVVEQADSASVSPTADSVSRP